MELELKHIAPYLPYRLRMVNEGHKELLESRGQQYHPSFLNGITHEGHMFIGKRKITQLTLFAQLNLKKMKKIKALLGT